MDDIVINKHAIIERCLRRVEEEYVGHEDTIEHNYTQQDSIILNIQRACQAAQDLANRVIRTHQLGMPQNARESFLLLADAKLITPDLAATLVSMVGFRNIAVHEYQRLNIAILRAVIEKHLADLLHFANQMLTLTS